MALRKKKVYKFSDEVISKDAAISLIFGGLALIGVISSVVYGVATKGRAPMQVGSILLASAIMSVTALLFGLLSLRDSDGGILSKRFSLILSLIDIALIVALYYI